MSEPHNWLDRLSAMVADPLEQRQARGLWLMLFGVCIAGVLAIMLIPFILGITPAAATLVAAAVLVIITAMVGMVILWRGRFQAAVITFSAGLLVTVGALAIALGYPAASAVLVTLTIPVVFSGLLPTRLASTIITIIAAALAVLSLVLQPVMSTISALVAPQDDLGVLTVTIFILALGVLGVALNTFGQTIHMALSRAQKDGARAEHALEQARAQAEMQQQLNSELEQARAALQDLVASLETPSVVLADGVLLAPIVGQIDSRRAKNLSTRLLTQTSAQRARLVILDITGVPTVDTAVAQALLKVAQGLKLLGCQVILSGISPSVAITLTHEGVNLAGLHTVRSPQDALNAYLQNRG